MSPHISLNLPKSRRAGGSPLRLPTSPSISLNLAAQAAARLAPLDPEWTVGHLLPTLVSRTTSSDLKDRHGSVHMLAEVLLNFVTVVHGAANGTALPLELRQPCHP